MQRWIVLGGLVVMLMFGGAIYAYNSYKQGKPHKMWVPMPLNIEVPEEKRVEIANNLRERLSTDEVLVQVSKDLGLSAKMELSSDAEAAAEVRKRLFVEVGEADSPRGRIPSINIGINGKVRDQKMSGDISIRLMDDVWKILGIKPPPRKE